MRTRPLSSRDFFSWSFSRTQLFILGYGTVAFSRSPGPWKELEGFWGSQEPFRILGLKELKNSVPFVSGPLDFFRSSGNFRRSWEPFENPTNLVTGFLFQDFWPSPFSGTKHPFEEFGNLFYNTYVEYSTVCPSLYGMICWTRASSHNLLWWVTLEFRTIWQSLRDIPRCPRHVSCIERCAAELQRIGEICTSH